MKTTIKELTDKLVEYNRHYYQNHESLVSDQEYDMLMKRLEKLEKQYPELRLSYSPTQHVGSDKSSGFSTVTHIIPMQSLENTYNETELVQFMTSVQKAFPKEVSFVTEFKIDGLSISCVYQDGVLIQASTRGDGVSGDDVTRNAMYIQDIPKKLNFEKEFGTTPHLFEIRGEVFMTYHDFEETNKIRAKKGLDPLANPRNAASGTLKTLDPSVFKERKLHALFYHVAQADELPLTQSDMFYAFDRLGIPHAPFYYATNQATVLQSIGKIARLRPQLSYPTDGAVVKVNEFALRPKLGQTAKYPRWAKAYKFSPNQVHTRVRDITIQVGRTGVLTPVAELEPVELDGSVVKRATLHNSDMIRKLDVRIGDTVLLEKAGEVIPHILCSISHEKGSKPYYLFEQVHGRCPSCHGHIVRKEDEVAWKCTNVACPARIEEQIVYGASKSALNIKGLGRSIIHALIASGKIKSFMDLFDLTKDDLVHLQLDDKSYVGINGEKIWNEIQRARDSKLDRWIVACGIPGVGPTIAQHISKSFNDLFWLLHNYEDYEELGMAAYEFVTIPTTPSVSDNIIQYLKQEDNILSQLERRNIHPKTDYIETCGPLYGKTFVITGALSKPRDYFVDKIRDLGGDVRNSVSPRTTYVVQGVDDRESAKAKKAKKLGLVILTEEQLNEMLSE